jgi:hypothetical protein
MATGKDVNDCGWPDAQSEGQPSVQPHMPPGQGAVNAHFYPFPQRKPFAFTNDAGQLPDEKQKFSVAGYE